MRAKILSPTAENLVIAVKAIQRDEVIGMPTETVYGLAGNCRSSLALARIFETKERPTFDPLIIHVSLLHRSLSELEKLKLVDSTQLSPLFREQVARLMHTFWPGPLTLVLPKHSEVHDLATSGLPTVAVRMPSHPVAQALISACQTPLAAPSANRFGRISPTSPEAVANELGDRIDWILDGGPSQIGLESTVVSFCSGPEPRLLRPGGIPQEEIEEILGKPFLQNTSSSSENSITKRLLPSPGMLESHYAPLKTLRLLPTSVKRLQPSDLQSVFKALKGLSTQVSVGLLLLSGDPETLGPLFSQWIGHPVLARTLSRQGILQEAAQNLFARMRELDSYPDLHTLFSEPCLEIEGLGCAIADRLKRASTH